jgi:condensin complex subunit 1
MTLAELTSLEALVGLMVEKDMITQPMIDSLWYVFAKQAGQSAATGGDVAKRRCGALMVLSMMARVRKEIISETIQTLLTIGLGELARDDFVLAKHTCIALQRLAPPRDLSKQREASIGISFPKISLQNLAVGVYP